MVTEVTVRTIVSRWDETHVLWKGDAVSRKDAVEKAVAEGANLEGANLGGANLEGAILKGANLKGANLGGAYLRGANLKGANLEGAILGGAILRGANLKGANLEGANLEGAILRGAYLRGATLGGATLGGADDSSLDTRIATGETWGEYLRVVVPALLTAGGKSLESFAPHWQCHTWDNCPMAHAFDVQGFDEVSVLWRPRVDQFIQFFDSGLIAWDSILSVIPLPAKES